ncbi:Integrase core domain [Nesidiocoris tenuis]|uniref:RNA-directed DNA polymerase n=1 Tax=Nesidiocoris tenuis TaxID=355587 RepID=A0ABN7B243_9HEMI|nr:Integrase core domain [Nesidiocoris tenuis]
MLKKKVTEDKTLQFVMRCIRDGWPPKRSLANEFWAYYEKREELSYEEDVLLWHGRIIVPQSLQQDVLADLHEGHPGEEAMKSIAKLQVWWPQIDHASESYVNRCKSCQKASPTGSQESPILFWNVPSEVWSRVHVDFAGPFEGKHWLIVVDATSKWLEVIPIVSTSAA